MSIMQLFGQLHLGLCRQIRLFALMPKLKYDLVQTSKGLLIFAHDLVACNDSRAAIEYETEAKVIAISC